VQATSTTQHHRGRNAKETLTVSVKAFDDMPDSALVDIKVVSLVCGQSVNTTWRRAREGKLTPIKTGPNSTRFRVGEIRAFLRSLQAA
jgi:predicted DNA-binding transcriptional regulator AlpA